ncbi:hypothetical protein DP107_13605 [Haloglomus irregulare]|mgnify:CR=1 FL=1|jgi:nucleotide-binding universal stress UspA family protein|uniref:Universal stress protein family protein n=2 Tax=Haloglomus irregulare TaxID=2234134 RepID=A0A554MXZ8_9EURY|nr:hypothetical protein DP107_13605 [Haloglomus irregulare]
MGESIRMLSVSDTGPPSPDGTTNRDGEAPVVGTAVTTAGIPREAIALAAAGHDAVVMGERGPSLRSFRSGEPAEQLAAQSLGPVVVRRHRDGEESTEPFP